MLESAKVSALPFEGVTESTLIASRETADVYRALWNEQKVIIKANKGQLVDVESKAAFQEEFEIGKSIKHENVVEFIALEETPDKIAIFEKDLEGHALDKLTFPLSLDAFFTIAIQICRGLDALHKAFILHLDIKPSNITFCKESQTLQIFDFSVSRKISPLFPSFRSTGILGTVTHLPPEATGRLEESCDFRSDLYSMGVTFYQLMTNTLPFTNTDLAELIHAHIAIPPQEPRKHNSYIPPVLSDLILKLLAKSPSRRYQTARGVLHDLEECRRRYVASSKKTIDYFELGCKDLSPILRISPVLYGHEEELQTLLGISNNIRSRMGLESSKGKSTEKEAEFVVVGGPTGVGKSTLIQAFISRRLQAPVRPTWDVAQCKFKRSVPYSGIIEAYGVLCRQMLSLEERKAAQLREYLLDSIDGKGAVLTEVLPDLALFLGPQSEVPVLDNPTESQNRFVDTAIAFTRAVAVYGSELVFILNDLNELDPASLAFLRRLVAAPALSNVFFIATYRNDGSKKDPRRVESVVEELGRCRGYPVLNLKMGPLSLHHVCGLVADSLHTSPARARSLASLLHDRTNGHPFFTAQILQSLAHNGLLKVDGEGMQWEWDEAKIAATVSHTENVVQFMAEAFARLDEGTRKVIAVASCISYKFRLRFLANLCYETVHSMRRRLQPAIEGGFITRVGKTDDSGLLEEYSFTHERVFKAALAEVDETDCYTLHFRIGRLMLSQAKTASSTPTTTSSSTPAVTLKTKSAGPNAPKTDIPSDVLFEILGHFNTNPKRLRAEEGATTALEYARLNLRAAQISTQRISYAAAIKYVDCACELLGGPQGMWEASATLAFRLYLCRMTATHRSGVAEESSLWLNLNARALTHAPSVWYKVKIHVCALRNAALRNDPSSAVAALVAGARLILPEFSVDGSFSSLKQSFENNLKALSPTGEVAGFVTKLTSTTPPTPSPYPAMSEPLARATLELLDAFFTHVFIIGEMNALVAAVSLFLHLVQAHGKPQSPLGFVFTGVVLGQCFGRYVTGAEWAGLAHGSHDAFPSAHLEKATLLRCKVAYTVYVEWWSNPLKHSWTQLKHLAKELKDCGEDVLYALASLQAAIHSLLVGKPLTELGTDTQVLITELQDHTSDCGLSLCGSLVGLLHGTFLLVGRPHSAYGFDGEEEEVDFNEEAFEESALIASSPMVRHTYYTAKLMYHYVLGDFDKALACADLALEVAERCFDLPQVLEMHFYYGLTLAALHPTLPTHAEYRGCGSESIPRTKDEATTLLSQSLLSLHSHSTLSEGPFRTRAMLLEAELRGVREELSRAVVVYDEAIALAREQWTPQIEALACECASRLLFAHERQAFGLTYYQLATTGYERWGAYFKVKTLKTQSLPCNEWLEQSGIHWGFSTSGSSSTLLSIPSSSLPTGRKMGLPRTMSSDVLTHTGNSGAVAVDALTTLKAAVTLAEDLDERSILIRLLSLAFEMAGADRGSLITLDEKGELVVSAQGLVGQDTVLEPIPLHRARSIADNIVRFVMRKGEPLSLDNPASDNAFSNNPHLSRNKPASVMCVPVMYKGALSALIYLENSVTRGAFPPSRVQNVCVLAAQLGVSLENAKLFARSVAARTQAEDTLAQLKAEKERSEQLQQRVSQLERDKQQPGHVDLDSPFSKALAILREQAPAGEPLHPLNQAIRLLSASETLFSPEILAQLSKDDVSLDKETKSWLMNELAASQTARRKSKRSSRRMSMMPVVIDAQTVFSGYECGFNFDILNVANITRNEPLFHTVQHVWLEYGLGFEFGVDRNNLQNFLQKVEKSYRRNPYHNSTHAADVCLSICYLLNNTNQMMAPAEPYFSTLDLLAAVIAAAVHDLGHRGTNNAFHVKSQDELALIYNDQSCLENFHVSQAFQIMKEKDCNIFGALNEEERLYLRRTVIEMVLATDMAKHFDISGRFKAKLNSPEGLQIEDKSLVLQFAIKMADVGHTAKPLELHKKWCGRLTEEFFSQGDSERMLNWPVSPFMDRTNANTPKSQVGFLQFVVIPLFELWHAFSPIEQVLGQLQENLAYWQGELAKQETHEP